MPTRQERRAAERDAAKRARGQAGAGAAGGAAAALANVHVNPVGDWSTQAAKPDLLIRALGEKIVKKRQGLTLVNSSTSQLNQSRLCLQKPQQAYHVHLSAQPGTSPPMTPPPTAA
jgi:hypothetical protein